MLTYDYFCEANGQTITVRHSITKKLFTWGELCEAAGTDLGETAANSPIERLIGCGNVMIKGKTPPPAPKGGSCGGGCACH